MPVTGRRRSLDLASGWLEWRRPMGSLPGCPTSDTRPLGGDGRGQRKTDPTALSGGVVQRARRQFSQDPPMWPAQSEQIGTGARYTTSRASGRPRPSSTRERLPIGGRPRRPGRSRARFAWWRETPGVGQRRRGRAGRSTGPGAGPVGPGCRRRGRRGRGWSGRRWFSMLRRCRFCRCRRSRRPRACAGG